MKQVKFFFFALSLFSLPLSGVALADEPATAPAPVAESGEKPKESSQNTWLQRFKPYGLNYGIWQFTEDDEQALEVQYSFKYALYDCQRYNEKGWFGCGKDARTKLSGFFSYTGKFDFYMFTRNSSPVINRTSNPALHANLEHEHNNGLFAWGDLGIEHRSNGQVVEVNTKDTNPASPTFGQYQTEIEYQKGNHEYFDRLSRDANYFNLAIGVKRMSEPNPKAIWLDRKTETNLDLGVKLYFTDDSDVTWGKYAGTGSRFKDFDLVRLRAHHTVKGLHNKFPEIIVGLEYLIGRKAFSTDSLDLYLIAPFISKNGGWEIPLMLKGHLGPMDRLSDYTRSVNSIGVGLVFSY
jgi:hypothetical protein